MGFVTQGRVLRVYVVGDVNPERRIRIVCCTLSSVVVLLSPVARCSWTYPQLSTIYYRRRRISTVCVQRRGGVAHHAEGPELPHEPDPTHDRYVDAAAW